MDTIKILYLTLEMELKLQIIFLTVYFDTVSLEIHFLRFGWS